MAFKHPDGLDVRPQFGAGCKKGYLHFVWLKSTGLCVIIEERLFGTHCSGRCSSCCITGERGEQSPEMADPLFQRAPIACRWPPPTIEEHSCEPETCATSRATACFPPGGKASR
jgi:hypothetical protein